jgi:hypothetical protein
VDRYGASSAMLRLRSALW